MSLFYLKIPNYSLTSVKGRGFWDVVAFLGKDQHVLDSEKLQCSCRLSSEISSSWFFKRAWQSVDLQFLTSKIVEEIFLLYISQQFHIHWWEIFMRCFPRSIFTFASLTGITFMKVFFWSEETHFTVVNYRSFTQLSKPALKNVYERYSGGSR